MTTPAAMAPDVFRKLSAAGIGILFFHIDLALLIITKRRDGDVEATDSLTVAVRNGG